MIALPRSTLISVLGAHRPSSEFHVTHAGHAHAPVATITSVRTMDVGAGRTDSSLPAAIIRRALGERPAWQKPLDDGRVQVSLNSKQNMKFTVDNATEINPGKKIHALLAYPEYCMCRIKELFPGFCETSSAPPTEEIPPDVARLVGTLTFKKTVTKKEQQKPACQQRATLEITLKGAGSSFPLYVDPEKLALILERAFDIALKFSKPGASAAAPTSSSTASSSTASSSAASSSTSLAPRVGDKRGREEGVADERVRKKDVGRTILWRGTEYTICSVNDDGSVFARGPQGERGFFAPDKVFMAEGRCVPMLGR